MQSIFNFFFHPVRVTVAAHDTPPSPRSEQALNLLETSLKDPCSVRPSKTPSTGPPDDVDSQPSKCSCWTGYSVPSTVRLMACTDGTDHSGYSAGLSAECVPTMFQQNSFFYLTGNLAIRNTSKRSFPFMILRFKLISSYA